MIPRILILLAFISLFTTTSACSPDRSFHGKVIDAETLEPIEKAVVVAIWRKTKRALISTTTDFKDAKETLTDNNGDWTIRGPEGSRDKLGGGLLALIGVYVTESPEFIIYKPGYLSYGVAGMSHGFEAYFCIAKEYDLEGVVLVSPGVTREERKKYYEKYRESLPFLPVKDPEQKLRNLKFSFEYPTNVEKIGHGIYRKGIRPFWVYTVVGLRKAKTKEERSNAMHFIIDKKLPLMSQILSEEKQKLSGEVRIKTYQK